MDTNIGLMLNTLRDPAGLPFYPVVFQILYVLTFAFHIAFAVLSLGCTVLSICSYRRRENSDFWKKLSKDIIQVAKVSVSLLIVLGVAPLLFTQVIYDPNWYVANTLSAIWVVSFIYILVLAYSLLYWFFYRMKDDKQIRGSSLIIGISAFIFLVFCGVLMHNFVYISLNPDKWLDWYAPNGIINMSGLVFHIDFIRMIFFFSLAIPVAGIFLLNYADYFKPRKDYLDEYLDKVKKLGKKIALVGLAISALLFIVWMLKEGLLLSALSIATILSVVTILAMVLKNYNSYIISGIVVIFTLLVSSIREYIKYNIMVGFKFDIYDYPVNIDWPTAIMFLLTFVGVGFTTIIFMLRLVWKAGRTVGVYQADKTDTKLGKATIYIFITWIAIFFIWGIYAVSKNMN